MIGETVSHYRITRQLGSGGMGVVYEAVDTKLNRTVALKFLPPELTRDPDAKARFLHEAQAVSALDHPNVCTVYEIGETDNGQLFLAMARYDGETLADLVKRGPQPIARVLDITRQVASGLTKAHDMAIVHRDIKPANIFLTADGLVKILDFGLAKLSGQTQLTRTGTTLGTPVYMSPEQAKGENVDQRTDLWSLGVVCYEMVTGHPPFRGDSSQAVIYANLNLEPKPLGELRADIPDSLDEVVRTALKKEAGNRYSSATAMLRDLGSSVSTTNRRVRLGMSDSPTVSVLVRPRRSRWALMGGLMLLLGVLAVAGSRFLILSPPGDIPAKVLAIVPFSAIGMGDESYFAEGISDAILNRLCHIEGLNVIARGTSARLGRAEADILVASRALGINYLLEGTVQQHKRGDSAPRILVRLRLVRTEDGVVLWSDTYEDRAGDVFGIQAIVAETVARELDVALLASDRLLFGARPTDNLAAYDHYLRGRDFQFKAQGHDDWNQARLEYIKAVNLAPDVVEAHSMLAQVEVWLYRSWGKQDGLEMGAAAVAQAVELNPENIATKFALADLAYNGRRDFDEAMKYYEDIQKAQPGNPDVWQRMGMIQRRKGLWSEASASLEVARSLDPLNDHISAILVEVYYWTGRFEDGLRESNRGLDSGFKISALGYESRALLQIGSDGQVDRGRLTLLAALDNVPIESWETGSMGTRLKLIRMYPDVYREVYERLDTAGVPARVAGETAIFKAELAWSIGDREQEAAWADTIVAIWEPLVANDPSDPFPRLGLALAYAHLERKDEFIKTFDEYLEKFPPEKDAFGGIAALGVLTEAAARANALDLAIEGLERLLSVPSRFHPEIIRNDPIWLPLLDLPGIRNVLEKHAD
jgi:serine/threonine protein kinase/tetratricopeptide (TPR) repeat protein